VVGVNGAADKGYVLLNDQPAGQLDEDLLGMKYIAKDLASVLVASIDASPFVLAVDAGWGMGKSTLLRQIENQLPDRPGIVKLHFNAWTSEEDNALEGLIKAVLAKLDPNLLRRTVRRLVQDRRVTTLTWLSFGVVARFFGVARLVDELWRRMTVNAKSRNELRDVIYEMLTSWVSSAVELGTSRALMVFIDDLDRCSDDVVVKICEAVKLYLDAPGLIFVMACDQSVLARGVSGSARGGPGEGRAYLEKIVQVAYRLPPPGDTEIKALIHEYARESGTKDLVDESVENILASGTARNPRRIKRIINSFVLEYSLDPAWEQLGSQQLVRVILLQHLYAAFYELLVSEDSGEDPVGEFLDYAELRDGVGDPPDDSEDPWWVMVRRTFKAHRLPVPETSSISREKLAGEVADLERKLPEAFPELARNQAFVALVRGIGDVSVRQALRAQLIRRPLATASSNDTSLAVSDEMLAGWRIVCIDDNPESLNFLVGMMESLGATVKVYSGSARADSEIQQSEPDAVISDITRGDDPSAGLDHVSRLRDMGYQGPVIFFTARITPERRQRAEDLNAIDIVISEEAVIDALSRVAHPRKPGRRETLSY
jgi:CheY-like chemotaxis protein